MTWYRGRGDAYCGMLNASYNLKLAKCQGLYSGVSCRNSSMNVQI